MDFEKFLLRGIPTEEAADFFIRVRGAVKEASPAEFEDAIASLPPVERAELLKSAGLKLALGAAAMGAGPPPMAPPNPLPPSGKGQNMNAQPPMPLPPTAMGQQPAMKMGSVKEALSPGFIQNAVGKAVAGGASGKRIGSFVENTGAIAQRGLAKATAAAPGISVHSSGAVLGARGTAGEGAIRRAGSANLAGSTALSAGAQRAGNAAPAPSQRFTGAMSGKPAAPYAAPKPSTVPLNSPSTAASAVAPLGPGSPIPGQSWRKMAAAEPEERGEQRARANFAAAHEKDRLTRGERWGNAGGGPVGALLGGAAGFEAGRRLTGALGGAAAGGLGGALLGHAAGKGLGGHLGHAADVRRFKKDEAKKHESKEAAAFKRALQEMGMAPQGIEPELAPETQQYLAMQQAGDQAAGQNEAQFLRMKLQMAQQEAQEASTQAQQLQAAQDQHDQQLAEIQQQVADSTQQANAAQDQVLQQQQAAAAMRMAFQQLRGTLLEAASAEPPQLPTPGADAAAAAASQAAGPTGAPSPTAGPAGQAAQPGTPPGSPAPMGDDTVSAPSASNEPMFGNAKATTSVGQQEQTGDAKIPNKEVLSHYLPFPSSLVKRASLREALAPMLAQVAGALPHAAVGAVLGGGMAGYDALSSNEPLQKKVQALEAMPDKGYRDTANLASSRAHLTMAEYGKEHPMVATGMGALGGALTGVALGPGAVRSAGHIGAIGKNIGTLAKGLFNKGAA